ncbi:OmpA family protein [Cellvibrio sp. QJXJ]|uniref:OmpA family protein n=1 Tax=Cellvibrio sp. QJXJ TaxID=2964606 RepID=UPI003965AA24
MSDALLRKLDPVSIYIVGHADSAPYAKNSKNSNGKLSLERATSVADELMNVNKNVHIQVIGLSDGLSAAGGVNNDASSSRRVDIFLVDSDQILDWYY